MDHRLHFDMDSLLIFGWNTCYRRLIKSIDLAFSVNDGLTADSVTSTRLKWALNEITHYLLQSLNIFR